MLRLDEYTVLYDEPGTGKKAIGKIIGVKILWDTDSELYDYNDVEFFNEHFKIIPGPVTREKNDENN